VQYRGSILVPDEQIYTWLCSTINTTVVVGTILTLVNTDSNQTRVRTIYNPGYTSLPLASRTIPVSSIISAPGGNVTVTYPSQYVVPPSTFSWQGTLPCLVSSKTDQCYTSVNGIRSFTAAAGLLDASTPDSGIDLGANCILSAGAYPYPISSDLCQTAILPSVTVLEVVALAEEIMQTALSVVFSTTLLEGGTPSTSPLQASLATAPQTAQVATVPQATSVQSTSVAPTPKASFSSTAPFRNLSSTNSESSTPKPSTVNFAPQTVQTPAVGLLVSAILQGLSEFGRTSSMVSGASSDEVSLTSPKTHGSPGQTVNVTAAVFTGGGSRQTLVLSRWSYSFLLWGILSTTLVI